jgi:hypothetical protein
MVMTINNSVQNCAKQPIGISENLIASVFFMIFGAVLFSVIYELRYSIVGHSPIFFGFPIKYRLDVILGAIYSLILMYCVGKVFDKKDSLDDGESENETSFYEFLIICPNYKYFVIFLSFTIVASIVWTPAIGVVFGIIVGVLHSIFATITGHKQHT